MGVGVESDEDVSAADIMMRVTCRFGPIPIMVSFVLDQLQLQMGEGPFDLFALKYMRLKLNAQFNFSI